MQPWTQWSVLPSVSRLPDIQEISCMLLSSVDRWLTWHIHLHGWQGNDTKAHHKRCNGTKIPHEVMSTVGAKVFCSTSSTMTRSGWAVADSELHTHRSSCKYQVHYQKGQAHSITFTLDCKFHQDCIYSCLYSTQLMGLGSWQERGRVGTITTPHCSASGWEGT